MRYPDPQELCRRITIQKSDTGRARLIYRANSLNPRAVWGQPVPSADGNAAFENYIVSHDFHTNVLVDSAVRYPVDHNPADIEPLIDQQDRAYIAYEHINTYGGAGLQETLRDTRDAIIRRTFIRCRDADLSTLAPDAVRYRAVKLTAERMCVSEDLVRRVLTAGGIAFGAPQVNPAQRAPEGRRPHKFSKAYEHLLKWKLLERVVQECRTNAKRLNLEHKFELADLHDDYAPGGYPTHCPVTGEEFDWDLRTSLHSPRVGRYDTTKGFVSGNVVLVSKLARRLTEGYTVRELPAILKVLPEIVDHYNAWRAKNPSAAPLPIPKARADVNTDPTTLKTLLNSGPQSDTNT